MLVLRLAAAAALWPEALAASSVADAARRASLCRCRSVYLEVFCLRLRALGPLLTGFLDPAEKGSGEELTEALAENLFLTNVTVLRRTAPPQMTMTMPAT